MRAWAFQAAVLVLLALIGVGVFLHSKNERYRFITLDDHTAVFDTATGDYWLDGGRSHVSPTKELPTASTAQYPTLSRADVEIKSDPLGQEPFWSASEKAEYDACLPDSLAAWKNPRVAGDYCLVDEEHKRWLRQHPQLSNQKENVPVMQQCLHSNATEINGSLNAFRTAYDHCEDLAYAITPH